HEHILRTPTEVKHARSYLVHNAYKHYKLPGPDDLAPRAPLYAPRTFMLRLQQ
ncbi:MAG: hypothetical protein JWN44_2347, partial [Myxococcales bacterium]|nr:hypothetical protein [Myxococcales bacterium]